MRGGGRSREKGHSRFCGFLGTIVVVISSQIDREMFEDRGSKACSVRDQTFIVEVRIANYGHQGWNPPGAVVATEAYAAAGIQFGGHSVRSGDGCPQHLMRAAGPCHTHARQ